MAETYSVYISENIESTSYPNVDSILDNLYDNDEKLIDPKEIRNAIISTFDYSAFKETTASASTISYIGVDTGNESSQKDNKLKIFFGKRELDGNEIMSDSLLNSDSDVFFYNTKEDSHSQIKTKLSFLSGDDFSKYPLSPYMGSQYVISESSHPVPYWSGLTSGTTNHLLSSSFVDNDTGWVCGYSGLIKKTTDGGVTWATQSSGIGANIYVIQFLNSSVGYAAGDANYVLKTTNGGASWSVIYTSTSTHYRSIYFLDINTGFIGGSVGSYIIKTTNGGSSWTVLSSPGVGIYGMFFTSSTCGYVSDFGGGIYKTINGGSSWVSQVSGTIYPLQGIVFTDNLTGYIASRGQILKTSNGGASWSSTWVDTVSGTNAAYSDIVAIDSDTIYAFGGTISTNKSIVLFTNDAGYSWTTQSSTYTRLTGASFPSSNVGYVAGLNGTILKLGEAPNTTTLIYNSVDFVNSGDINIKSVGGSVSINELKYPSVANSELLPRNSQVLRYNSGSYSWSDITIESYDTIGITGSQLDIGGDLEVNGSPFTYTNLDTTPVSFHGVIQSRTFSKIPIVEMLREIIYDYLPPICTLSSNQSFVEYGTVPTINLNYSVYKRTSNISSVSLSNMIPGSLLPITSTVPILVSGTAIGAYVSNINAVFTITAVDGTQSVSASQSLTYIYPYFYGLSINSTMNVSNLSGLNKLVSGEGDKICGLTGYGYIYFIYDDNYPPLTQILDDSNFNVIGAFNYTVVTLTSPTWLWSYKSFKVYRSISSLYNFSPPSKIYKFKY
jgi:photosystem II stability/assembly factor-like uncharacterized protein